MTDQIVTRRTVLKVAGASVGAAVAGVGGAAAQPGWTVAETPTGNTLHGVVETAEGPYAVGEGGVVLRRTSDGWEKVLDGGPTGNGNDLYGAGVTDDGRRLWFAGTSGAIGEYDVVSGTLYDHSAPNDVTNNFNDVAVTGPGGDANVYVAGDSGKIYYSFGNGDSGTWDSTTPGSGAAVHAIDFFDDRSGHAVDGNQTVFCTDDGATYDRIGIADADHDFYGVDSDGFDDATVSGGGGTVWNWDGAEWTREDTGDADLRDVEADGTPGLTVGGGGAVFRRDGTGWHREDTPTGENLRAVLYGDDVGLDRDIAVGAGGTIIEK